MRTLSWTEIRQEAPHEAIELERLLGANTIHDFCRAIAAGEFSCMVAGDEYAYVLSLTRAWKRLETSLRMKMGRRITPYYEEDGLCDAANGAALFLVK